MKTAARTNGHGARKLLKLHAALTPSFQMQNINKTTRNEVPNNCRQMLETLKFRIATTTVAT